MNYYILDERDNPNEVAREEYWAWHESLPQDIQTGCGFTLAYTKEGEVAVSTVYLGLDHNYSGIGPPVLWETMVFFDGGGDDDQSCQRSTNRVDALNTHRDFCDKYIYNRRS